MFFIEPDHLAHTIENICSIQFLNNDDPRIISSTSGQPAVEVGVDGSGARAASRKRPHACPVCAARKVKCKHYQNEGVAAGSSGQIGAEGAGWTREETARMVTLVSTR